MQKNLFVFGTLGCLLAVGLGCSSKTANTSPVASSGAGKGTTPAADTAKKQDQAMVRFVNATPASKDLAFGDTTPFSNVGKYDVTAYELLPAERHDFKLTLNGDAAKTLATNSEGLTSGKHYTVIAETEKDGKFELNPIDDDLTPPSPNMAKVRVINLAPTVKEVDLYSGTKKDALFSGVGLNHATDYKEVALADGALDIRNTHSKKDSEKVKDVQMEAGKLYTILVFGGEDGKLKVKTVEDVFTAAPNGTKS